ncbi:MAG: cupin domain-containing protein [Solirubrobacteraceae bacterium]
MKDAPAREEPDEVDGRRSSIGGCHATRSGAPRPELVLERDPAGLKLRDAVRYVLRVRSNVFVLVAGDDSWPPVSCSSRWLQGRRCTGSRLTARSGPHPVDRYDPGTKAGPLVIQDGAELMNSWDIRALAVAPHSPEILSTNDDARAVVLEIPAGESLQEHQVHERTLITVIDGEVEITTADGDKVVGGPGLLVELAPAERHTVLARSTVRLLLLLTPWPGQGHPGSMTLEDKANATQRAAEHRVSP